MSASVEPESYSRAFERLVRNGNDLTGFIAYALYKQAIREAVTRGTVVLKSADRHPTETEVKAYRTIAETMLADFADSVVDQSRPAIANAAIRSDLATLETNLTSIIQRSTAWRAAIATNLISWLLSIAITVLILFAGGPAWINALINRHP